MKTFTAHDAVRLIKYEGFFKKLKHYQVIFRVYPLNDPLKPGIFYVILKNEDQIVDTAYEVNLFKKSFTDVDFEGTLEKIQKLQLLEFPIPTERRKGSNYGHG